MCETGKVSAFAAIFEVHPKQGKFDEYLREGGGPLAYPAAREKGRFAVFEDHHLRAGEVIADSGTPGRA